MGIRARVSFGEVRVKGKDGEPAWVRKNSEVIEARTNVR